MSLKARARGRRRWAVQLATWSVVVGVGAGSGPGLAGAGPLLSSPAASSPAALNPAAIGPSSTTSGRKGCPPNLAGTLSSTGRSRQLITVEAARTGTSAATMELWHLADGCWAPVEGPWAALIGVNGFSSHHREGDGTTPTGIFGIGPVMYGNAPNPGVKYSYRRLVCGDWWDEDPRSTEYNTFQHVPCDQAPPFGGGSEALWTETVAYPSFAVIEYNAHPVVAYAGSAIFIHADIGVPTAGCVSVPLGELDTLLRWLEPGSSPAIAMGPAHQLARL